MRKYLFLFVFLSVAPSAAQSPPNSPLAFWHFDDGKGTVSSDSSGNGIGATLKNGPLWSTGRANGALSFDGINDYVSAGASNLLDDLTAFTVEAWVYPSAYMSASLGRQIVNKGNKRFSFSDSDAPSGNGTLTAKVPFSGGITTTYSSTIVPLNQWSHVALTVDGAGDRKAHIYLNGREVAYYQQPAGSGTIVADVAPNNWFIGSYNGTGRYFAGKIDEVVIYGVSLPAAAILQDYDYIANDSTPPAVPAGLSGSPLSDTQVNLAWTAAIDNVGVTGYQVSRGSVVIGTSAAVSFTDSGLAPATAYSYTVAAYDAAGNFSAPSNSVTVTTLNPPDTTPPSAPATLTATALSATQIGLSWPVSIDNVGVTGYQVFRGSVAVGTSVNTAYTDSGLAQNTTYTYTVRAFDAAGNTSAPSPQASATTLTSPDTTPPTVSIASPAAGAVVTGTVTVAASASDNVGVAGVQFKLDGNNLGAEVTTAPYSVSWNSTLSTDGPHTLTAIARDAAGNIGASAAVGVNVNNATSSTLPVGYWNLDDGSGTIAADSTGSGVNAALVNGPSWKFPGRVNGSVSFDGVNDYVNVSPSPKLDNLQAFSLQVWINPLSYIYTGTGLTTAVFSKGNSIKRLQFADTDTPGVTVGALAGRVAFSNTAAASVTSNTVPLNAWSLITMTFDPALDGKIHLYLNDREASYLRQVAGAGTITPDGGTTPPGWILGALQGTGRFFQGQIDEPKIYNRALTLTEIQQYYNSIVSDAVAPNVTVTNPSGGSTVSGTSVFVSAAATDNVGVVGVQFKLDGNNLGTERTSPPYTLNWDTTPFPNGQHILSAVARDAAGNTANGNPVSVTVANSLSDTVPPVVSLLAPLDSRTVSRTITAWAAATDNVSVAGVQFYVDGLPAQAELTAAPYAVRIDTTLLSGGAHVISATARDAAGNSASSQVSITVDNTNPASPPNIVFILSDDQRVDAMQYMPLLTSLLANDSVQFDRAYVSTPLCCPSRAGIFTGLYSHNTGVLTNKAPWGGATVFNDSSTVATWLKQMGYRTGLFGKYLNQYELIPTHIPPGWDEWHAFTSSVRPQDWYYDYAMNDNGVMTQYGSLPQDYGGTVAANKALQFLQSAAASTQPFFLYFAPFAPHEPATPAPPDVGTYSSIPPWRPAAYNEADVSDKPSWIRNLPPFNPSRIAASDALHQKIAESLQSVDRAASDLIDVLKQTGKWNNTIFIYMSDNGLSFGEHRWLDDKECAYEECTRVPLWVRVPGTPARHDTHLVQNIDIAPAIADWAGFLPPARVNGLNLAGLVSNPATPWRSTMLLEDLAITTNGALDPSKIFQAVHDSRYVYVEYQNGEKELYDLQADPDQLTNVVNDPGYAGIIPGLQAQLAALKNQ